ncbi:LysR family transcriptional regulator [Curvibacter sp. CHRR-16]|uniref:LysR family transcriptional regulator n=1 Tax=Curvibacter sp. CHRR-16 TaxID=2835872 RepID=UPI001BDA1165|nr:LysR family transcriptional regulator [Curvibacter sp. CHRR-16]MBT0570496.1 LysR family transcriptional regulator [Curvibacter sp. CHRR-16]
MTADINLDRLDLLRTLVCIVESRSLTGAAQVLGTSQPTVSRRLKQLERYWGMQLLQRSTHSLQLTVDGERCYQQAKDLLEQWAAMEASLRGSLLQLQGRLRVRVPTVFGQEKLIPALGGFMRQHPQVVVEWYLSDGMPDFVADGIDCCIRVGEVHAPHVVAIRMAWIDRIVVAAPSFLHQHTLPNAMGPADVQDLPWLAMDTFYRHTVQLRQRQTGATHSIDIRPCLVTDNLHTLCNAAVQGLGLAVVSAWAVAEHLHSQRLVQVLPDWYAAPLPLSLVYPHSPFPAARLKAFISSMREHFPMVEGMLPPDTPQEGG